MKRFLVATSSTDKNDLKKTKIASTSLVEEAIDESDSALISKKNQVSPTESDCFDQVEQINVSQNYLFNGKFYNIVSNKSDGNKLVAKCVLCSKIIQGQINSTGNC
ncbi:hypothetical protein QTP88_025441 [Uroleucon formosanum]